MDEMKKFFDISSVIALRKTAYFEKVWYEFSRKIPSNVNVEELRNEIKEIIANLDNKLFISDEEQKTKTIDPNLPLEKLNLNENLIIKSVDKKINELK
jgi:hypothetical protein